VIADYPSPSILSNLRSIVARNITLSHSPLPASAVPCLSAPGGIAVEGHEWGVLESDSFALANRGKFDRVLAADCLWMPWQHDNLRRSVAWFLKDDADARAWVIGGFHTRRDNMARFFSDEKLREVGLETEWIWERDCDGVEREWAWDRGFEDPAERKRWLVVAVLRRVGEEGREGQP
jgi:nicotinamide N-methyltransferase